MEILLGLNLLGNGKIKRVILFGQPVIILPRKVNRDTKRQKGD